MCVCVFFALGLIWDVFVLSPRRGLDVLVTKVFIRHRWTSSKRFRSQQMGAFFSGLNVFL